MAFDPITAIADFAGKVVDKIFPDKTEAAKAKAALDLTALQNEFNLVLGQLQINSEEAKHASIFVAGARPFILWVCGAAFSWSYVIGPMFYWFSSLFGHSTPIPTLNLDAMMPVLLGLLGLGGYRTFEKVKNVASNH